MWTAVLLLTDPYLVGNFVGEELGNVMSGGVVGCEAETVPLEAIRAPPGSAEGTCCEPCPREAIVPLSPKCLVNASGCPSDGVCVAFMSGKLVEVYDRKLAGCESS